MKTLDVYFLMVVFMLLLNRVHVFANFMFNLDTETWKRNGYGIMVHISLNYP